ncbi:pyridoxal phosphate-dependent aminotransferase [Gemmatimonadota bacterium]
MRRRAFLRNGLLALGAPAVLPLDGRGGAFLTLRQRRQEQESIRLSSNENPLGIPPGSRDAILKGIEEANRYPSWARRSLTEALAEKHGVEPAGIVLGNGSTEVLQMGVQAQLDPQLRLVAPTPTFEDVFEYSEPHPWIDLRPIPLTDTFAHDLPAMERETNGAPGPVLAYVCNPNNPTGSLTSVGEVEAWIRRAPENVHFLVDEAYFEFVDSDDFRSLDRLAWENPNVVVVRTFSKVYGMAGLRLGYGVAHPDTARRLGAFAAGPNTNQLALVAGLAALEDADWVAKSVEANLTSRRIAYQALDELDLEYIPSHTNFVMHRIGGDLQAYIGRMREAGIRVGRPFPPMLDYNRCSFGVPKEMERWADTIRDFRKNGWV